MGQRPEAGETKRALLLAAGELFAEKGRDGASVRDIVKKAGATLSAVNYHFGSKEQLYVETVRYVLSEKITFGDLFSGLDRRGWQSPQEASNAVYRAIWALFLTFMAPGQPEWPGRLITRAFLELDPSEQSVFREATMPADAPLRRLVKEYVPGATDEYADMWITSLYGQVQFYVLAKHPILEMHEIERFELPLLEDAAFFVARTSLLVLGLPEPQREALAVSEEAFAAK